MAEDGRCTIVVLRVVRVVLFCCALPVCRLCPLSRDGLAGRSKDKATRRVGPTKSPSRPRQALSRRWPGYNGRERAWSGGSGGSAWNATRDAAIVRASRDAICAFSVLGRMDLGREAEAGRKEKERSDATHEVGLRLVGHFAARIDGDVVWQVARAREGVSHWLTGSDGPPLQWL